MTSTPDPLPSASSNAHIVHALQQQVSGVQHDFSADDSERISSGCMALDRQLPQQGFRQGSLIEWLSDHPGSGAELLSLLAARQALQQGGAMVVLDQAKLFYPPAAAAWGIDLDKLILIRTTQTKDTHWALDQALRCRGVAVVWSWLGQLDNRWFRRFQLAAESSGCLGLFLRSSRVRGRPTWSDLQLQVKPQSCQAGRRFQLELVRCRGQGSPFVMELELNELTGELREVKSNRHETSALHLATQLAHPTTRRRSTRA